MNAWHGHLAAAARAISFPARHDFAWFGKRPAELRASLRRALDEEARRQHFLSSLQDQLYRNLYCPGFARPIRWVRGDIAADEGVFGATLRSASSGSGCWEAGWTIRSIEGGQVIVARDGLAVATRADALRRARDGPLQAGEPVCLHTPPLLPSASPGFLLITGDAPGFGGGPTVRLYWNIAAAGAAPLAEAATRLMNLAGIPFRLKLISHPARYDRCDAAVLYLGRQDIAAASEALSRIRDAVTSLLDPLVPLFAKPIAPGVGLAESPADGQSFGMHRCGALAHGFAAAAAAGAVEPAAQLAHLERALNDAGIALDRPHLEPDSHDDYDDVIGVRGGTARRARAATAKISPSIDDIPTLVADRLCRSALWHRDRCTWLETIGHDDGGSEVATLGPDLYGGLTGVALFLAMADTHADRDDFRRTARAAILQSHRLIDTIPADRRCALYTGWLGIALAEWWTGRRLGDERLVAGARALAERVVAESGPDDCHDLLSGGAGTIVGALRLAAATGSEALAALAVDRGDRLIAAAIARPEGLSWRTINKSRDYNLTGFSHGTAGIAYALLKLFDHCGEHRFREAATAAIAYEQRWFDPVDGNWPDLREARPSRSAGDHALDHSTYWCHGAPGIGLSRIAAWRSTGDGVYRDQALTALASTLASVDREVPIRPEDLGLCHGFAGNADILLSLGRALGNSGVTGLAGAGRVAARAAPVLRRLEPGAAGADAFQQPGLMTGLAGAGWLYLRLLEPGLPSVLNGFSPDDAPLAAGCSPSRA